MTSVTWREMVQKQIDLWKAVQEEMNAVPWAEKTYYHKRRWVHARECIKLFAELLRTQSDQSIEQYVRKQIDEYSQEIRKIKKYYDINERGQINLVEYGELRKNFQYILYALTGEKPENQRYKHNKYDKLRHASSEIEKSR